MATIAITGASGLIGRALEASLVADAHDVVRVGRDAASSDVHWDPSAARIDAAALEGLDAVVHLAGEPLGASRWTRRTRARIRDSRVEGTALLARALAGLDNPPATLISASAVGYYGDRGDSQLAEQQPPGDDFLADLCVAWEAAAAPAGEAGIRVVHPRTGVVIAHGGPLIEKVELPFRLGLGGRIGSGRQYVPWISLADHVRALRHVLDGDLTGPVNFVAPQQVTNRELTKAIGTALRRPTVFPIPVLALKVLYGEMGTALATVSQRVVPERLLASGFVFEDTDLTATLVEMFARPGVRR